MSKLPLLEKNAYLSIVIKDDGIWAHLAYTDHNANREYILSDFTDLHPLRYRLDDDVFTKTFWAEYFHNLEKVFNWDIVDEAKNTIFAFEHFKKEGEGISGVRIQIDDNQRFFDKIFASVREFSKDISLRVVNDEYMQKILEGLVERSEYDDIMYVDMDLMDFSIFRVQEIHNKKGQESKKLFSRAKISWKDILALIDSIKDSRFRAFLATDLGTREMSNYWSNFISNRIFSSEDPNLIDILRSYCTIQNHSLFRDNNEKLEGFGISGKESCLIVSGYIPRVLGKSKSLLTLVDGLELKGVFDCCWDLDLKLLSYGKSYIEGTNSTDIILTASEVLSAFTKVLIPNVKESRASKRSNQVVFSGTVESLSEGKSEIFALSSKFSYVDIPLHEDKVVVEGQLKKGSHMYSSKNSSISFISIPDKKRYESLLIDARPRPVVYGPDSYSNKLKLEKWLT
jgi:hypothetical protein